MGFNESVYTLFKLKDFNEDVNPCNRCNDKKINEIQYNATLKGFLNL